MASFRTLGIRYGLVATGGLAPGDTLMNSLKFPAAGEPGAIGTAGDGAWTAAAIVSGLIQRTGPVGAYADTTATSTEIMNALAGNGPAADVVPGLSWNLLVRNTVAQVNTVALGLGMRTIGGTSLTIAASLVREYIFTVLNASPQVILTGTTTNASPTVPFVFPSGISAWPIGPAVGAANLTPGMTISGTGVTAGTRIKSVTQGPGGITGIVMDANATADGAVSITFLPTIGVDTLRSSTL